MTTRSDTSPARLIVPALALLALSACDLLGEPVASGKAVDGQVLEASTGKPLSGAIVVATWSGIVGSLAHSQGVCFHVESTTTDEQGRYHIPAWEKRSRFARAKHKVVTVIAFKPGYSFVDRTGANTVQLERFSGTREERLGYLLHASGLVGCYSASNEKPLISIYKSLYDEAKRIVISEKEKDALQTIRRRALYAWSRPSRELTTLEIEQAIQNDPYLREQFQ
jgi:hypothetical protein